jgi:tetratricopeptide (TPR) repeat protein
MLTGRSAWTGDSALAIITARMLAPPPDPRATRVDVPAPLAELVLRMIARLPGERPNSAREVLDSLAALVPTAGSVRLPRHASQRAPRQVQCIAVVPLACEEDDAAHATAFGIAELVADALDGRPGIDVRARGVRLAPRAHRELTAIGAELDIPLVVGGSLAGGVARLTLVNARDGFVLWSRTFPNASRDPFGAAYDAAREIAEVLLVPAAPPPAAPPADARTMDLLLRARFEISRSTPDAADRAISLLERAYSHTPEDPWVNAAYALALAHRLADTEFPGDADEALAMASAASLLAPRLAASHHALAEVLIDRGDLVGAAKSAALARALAPGNAEVERVVAHLAVEAGAIDLGLSLLRSASTRDVASSRAIWDEARALAAQERWQEADERLDAASDLDPLAADPWLGRARCALFRRDLVRCDVLRVQLGEVLASDKEPIVRALDAVLARAPIHTTIDLIEAYATSTSCSRQRGDALRKLAIDVAGTCGESARVMTLLTALARAGIVDMTWLEFSPTLAGVRATPAFAEIRKAAATRARAIRAALESVNETIEGAAR